MEPSNHHDGLQGSVLELVSAIVCSRLGPCVFAKQQHGTSPGRGKRITKTVKDVSSPPRQPEDNGLSYVGNHIYVVGRAYTARPYVT